MIFIPAQSIISTPLQAFGVKESTANSIAGWTVFAGSLFAGKMSSVRSLGAVEEVANAERAAAVAEEVAALPNAAKLHNHHVFPQQFKKWFSSRGVSNIDDYTIPLSSQTHLRGVHGNGLGYLQGEWNQKWATFIGENPYATPSEIFYQGESLLNEFGFEHLKYVPYK